MPPWAAGRALLEIVNDVLDLSKIEAGRMEIARAPFSLGDVVSGVADLMTPRARQKGLEVQLVIQGCPPAVYGDAGRIRQIVSNLSGNAVKFTDRGHVALKVARGAERDGVPVFLISVEGTGIGLQREKLACLFEDFVQVDCSAMRAHDGAGLGLAISRRVARMLGGDIAVESAPGEGSVFVCTLPLPVVTGVTADNEHAGGIQPLADWVASPDREPFRALLVEDNPVNQQIGQRMLKRLGCVVDVARNGQ